MLRVTAFIWDEWGPDLILLRIPAERVRVIDVYQRSGELSYSQDASGKYGWSVQPGVGTKGGGVGVGYTKRANEWVASIAELEGRFTMKLQ